MAGRRQRQTSLCVQCGAAFHPWNRHQLTCSRTCTMHHRLVLAREYRAKTFVPLLLRGDAVVVPLTKGRYATVSASDYPMVSNDIWFCIECVDGHKYAARSERGRFVLMHRVVAGTPDHLLTDHIDGNGLNNRRSNLRNATPTQNQINRGSTRGSSSRFKGVVKCKRSGKWLSRINLGGGREHHLGVFSEETDAAKAYDDQARVHHGEFARMNFSE